MKSIDTFHSCQCTARSTFDLPCHVRFAVITLLTVANSTPDTVDVVVLSIACAACKKPGQLTLSPTPQRGIYVSTIHSNTVSMGHDCHMDHVGIIDNLQYVVLLDSHHDSRHISREWMVESSVWQAKLPITCSFLTASLFQSAG
jgi:hypothetical protein